MSGRVFTPEDHAARIAYLVVHPSEEPIEVDFGIPALNCYVDWPITDGNHRLAAAIIRGDKSILADVAGDWEEIRRYV